MKRTTAAYVICTLEGNLGTRKQPDIARWSGRSWQSGPFSAGRNQIEQFAHNELSLTVVNLFFVFVSLVDLPRSAVLWAAPPLVSTAEQIKSLRTRRQSYVQARSADTGRSLTPGVRRLLFAGTH